MEKSLREKLHEACASNSSLHAFNKADHEKYDEDTCDSEEENCATGLLPPGVDVV